MHKFPFSLQTCQSLLFLDLTYIWNLNKQTTDLIDIENISVVLGPGTGLWAKYVQVAKGYKLRVAKTKYGDTVYNTITIMNNATLYV